MHYHQMRMADLIGTLSAGWSIRKLEASLKGLFAAWAVYFVSTYVALMAGPYRSEGFPAIFRYFEFFPWLPSDAASTLGMVIWITGIVVSVYLVLNAGLAVAVIAVEDAGSNTSFMVTDAFRFTRMHRGQLVVSLGVLAAIAGVFIAGLSVAAAIVRIPVFGEFFLGVCALPIFLWVMVGAVAFLTFLFGFNTVPAIIASGASDVLETAVEAYAVAWSRPVRFILLQIATRLLFFSALALLTVLFLFALVMMGMVLSPVDGQKLDELFTVALYRIPCLMESETVLRYIIGSSAYLGTPEVVPTLVSPATVKTAGWILGLSFLGMFMAIAAYGFSVFWTAQVVILGLVKGASSRGEKEPAVSG